MVEEIETVIPNEIKLKIDAEERPAYPYVGEFGMNIVLFTERNTGVVISSFILELGTFSQLWKEEAFNVFTGAFEAHIKRDEKYLYPCVKRNLYPVWVDDVRLSTAVDVLFTEPQIGFVVKDPHNRYGIGYWLDTWLEDVHFELINEEVVIKNLI